MLALVSYRLFLFTIKTTPYIDIFYFVSIYQQNVDDKKEFSE